VEFEEVVLLMQGQTPRVFPEAFRAARFSTGHLILCLISIAMGLFGILLAYIGLVSLDTFAGFFWSLPFITLSIVLLLYISRQRMKYLEILRDGVLAHATIQSLGGGRDTPSVTNYQCTVHFESDGETVCRPVTVKGMQVMSLRKCVDSGDKMPLLYLRHDPNQFILAAKLTNWDVTQ